jgi:FKBP-type peptidyl-prolyl cis-trans isomerase (trigger factor)
MNETQNKNYTVKDLKDGKYEITITIPADLFKKSYEAALAKTAQTIELKGFRKGKVPVNVVEEQMKPAVLIETFEKIAPTYSWVALGGEKLEPLMPVEYTNLPKLELDKDIVYMIKVVTMPTFKLPEIKDIKVEKQKPDVTEKELDTTMEEMFKNNGGVAAKEGEKATYEKMDDKWATDTAGKYGIKGVTTLAKLREEVKKILEKQKADIVEKEFERGVLRKAIELAKLNVPDEAIHYEAHEREHSFMHQLEDAGLTLEGYLKQYDMKIEDMEKAWHDDSRTALEEHIFLNKYAVEKKLEVNETEFAEFVKQVAGNNKEQYTNKAWLESLYSLFFKQKAFEKMLTEVKESLGIKDVVKKELILE